MPKSKYPTEYEECRTFADWLKYQNLMFSHIPSGTNTVHMGTRMKNKAMGLNRGVPDYVIITPKGLLFVEMKRKRGSKTYPEQLEWKQALNKLDGVQSEICFGCDSAIEFVEQFLQTFYIQSNEDNN